ncbi:outer membrane assembly protein AsmA [Siccibacter colletis]|uniref:outer membrane assembly protein AsmA n=1 Tax=Siccibacter colletis TaxID=1505757 RepID=UPI0028BE09A6|nr:outer membrane assembly protein AsmA [Siccibacter colletis]WNN47323.1 outer membrane assembly protein AsmA [Siccibacter colletis]
MRRLLTTLMILLVVLVAGLSALVMLVNPNDFRAYMVREVEARSGYQLKLDGPLRWHVWPQLSILSGRMSLTAPGATDALVSADNMRLDVALWPLLSHQLQVQQVMLKGAVIQLTPQSEARRPENAPVGPRDTVPHQDTDPRWSFDIARLKVADSLLVFQHEGDEQVTVRNINIDMEQNDKRQASIELSGRITRDQRDLTLAMSASLDRSDYPQRLTADISQLGWQLRGAGLPQDGISGQASFQALWQEPVKKLSFSNLALTANDSALKGEGSVVLDDTPRWMLDLRFDKLNLENLLASDAAAGTTPAQKGQQAMPVRARPVISAEAEHDDYQMLRGFIADARLKANSVRWRGLDFTQVNAVMKNNAGLLEIGTLDGVLGNGRLSLPGKLDARSAQPSAAFRPAIDNIEIGSVLKAFNYPIALTGAFSLRGDFAGDRIDALAFRDGWRGEATIEMANSRMEGLNFQQLVQQAVERSSSNVSAQQNYDNATSLASFSASARLNNGQLRLDQMKGESAMLALDGNGLLDLVKEQCDTRFNVRVTDGWKGDSDLIARLKKTAVPLRVYGPWQQLSYSLEVDQVLRKQLQDEAKRRLNEWADRHKNNEKSKDVKELIDKL